MIKVTRYRKWQSHHCYDAQKKFKCPTKKGSLACNSSVTDSRLRAFLFLWFNLFINFPILLRIQTNFKSDINSCYCIIHDRIAVIFAGLLNFHLSVTDRIIFHSSLMLSTCVIIANQKASYSV